MLERGFIFARLWSNWHRIFLNPVSFHKACKLGDKMTVVGASAHVKKKTKP